MEELPIASVKPSGRPAQLPALGPKPPLPRPAEPFSRLCPLPWPMLPHAAPFFYPELYDNIWK